MSNHHIIKYLRLASALTFMTCTGTVIATPLTPGQMVPLWAHTAMDRAPANLHAQVVERSKDPAVHDRAWLHITKPGLLAFPAGQSNSCSVIIAPGGGYMRVVFDKEGEDMVPMLNKHGLNVFILKYRLPGDGFSNRDWVPLQDAQRAIRTIRYHAKDWNLNSQCVGILGFSAGGQLAASLATEYNRPVYPIQDQEDKLSARPDFVGLMYPVISMQHSISHLATRRELLGRHPTRTQIEEHSLDKQVTPQTPIAFIGLADDDKSVNQMHSILFYEALHKAHVQTEMHIFQHSGHGFGIRNAKGNAKQWLPLFTDWLKQNHFAS